ncbi:invasion associated locus B family protein [Tardiphaga alba]|uniref:Invasion associated locus B family protein n=1 Tax=Tardiphaga alba TaxID=340268 RepID=A0ABX8AAK7_9BRAD|nr:invasion associated locus B family protein [Tardiphaga alba]QUS40502.1 invasion associated locus B family protein [Tardiphaga alba]
MTKHMITAAAVAAAILAAPAMAGAQSSDATKAMALPGGSSSLQETFEGWTLQCAATEAGRACNVQQQQRHRESKQLVLAVELATGANGAVSGAFVLPFGLRLASGAVLQIDDLPVSQPIAFSTCLPVGCVVPLTFDKAAITRLRSAKALKVTAAANEDGKAVPFAVSLNGLPAALDRLAALSQPAAKDGRKQ